MKTTTIKQLDVCWTSPEAKKYYDFLGEQVVKVFQLPAHVFDPRAIEEHKRRAFEETAWLQSVRLNIYMNSTVLRMLVDKDDPILQEIQNAGQ